MRFLGNGRWAIVSALLVACGGQDPTTIADGSVESRGGDPKVSELASNGAVARQDLSPGSLDTLPVLASTTAENGDSIKFLDTGDGILVTEDGIAPRLGDTKSAPAAVLNTLSAETRRDLVQVWHAVAPSKKIPDALLAASKRRVNPDDYPVGPAAYENTDADSTSGGTDTKVDDGGVHPLDLIGCGNGCCDPDWLANDMCSLGGDWHWFLFNYGYSHAQSTNHAWTTTAMECSAIGESHFVVTIRGTNHGFFLPEQHYKIYFWVADLTVFLTYLKGTVISNVNQDWDHNMHTNCGDVGE